MSHQLRLRDGLLDRIRAVHAITSDVALAGAIGVSPRTITRIKADPTAVQADVIAGICAAFGYSPSDVVVVEHTTKRTAA